MKVPSSLDGQATDPKIVMSCMAAGMYPKLLMTDASGVFRTLTHNAPASIHPSSINFNYGKKPDLGDARYAVYCNVIQTKKLCEQNFRSMLARMLILSATDVWETGPVDEVAVLLMCGSEVDIKYPARTYSLDRKIRVRLPSKSALALKAMRQRYHQAFERAMVEPQRATAGLGGDEWWTLLQDLLKTEPSELEEQTKELEKKLTVR